MADTFIHKFKAKAKMDLLAKVPLILENKWNRHNSDYALDKIERLAKIEKQATKDLERERKEAEQILDLRTTKT